MPMELACPSVVYLMSPMQTGYNTVTGMFRYTTNATKPEHTENIN